MASIWTPYMRCISSMKSFMTPPKSLRFLKVDLEKKQKKKYCNFNVRNSLKLLWWWELFLIPLLDLYINLAQFFWRQLLSASTLRLLSQANPLFWPPHSLDAASSSSLLCILVKDDILSFKGFNGHVALKFNWGWWLLVIHVFIHVIPFLHSMRGRWFLQSVWARLVFPVSRALWFIIVEPIAGCLEKKSHWGKNV